MFCQVCFDRGEFAAHGVKPIRIRGDDLVLHTISFQKDVPLGDILVGGFQKYPNKADLLYQIIATPLTVGRLGTDK
jgi:hypothetical protein